MSYKGGRRETNERCHKKEEEEKKTKNVVQKKKEEKQTKDVIKKKKVVTFPNVCVWKGGWRAWCVCVGGGGG